MLSFSCHIKQRNKNYLFIFSALIGFELRSPLKAFLFIYSRSAIVQKLYVYIEPNNKQARGKVERDFEFKKEEAWRLRGCNIFHYLMRDLSSTCSIIAYIRFLLSLISSAIKTDFCFLYFPATSVTGLPLFIWRTKLEDLNFVHSRG